MPVKKQSKTRTSKLKSKNQLKWWYILPVIAIVAVAGYAIVRFSEAGSSYRRIRTTTSGRATAPEFSACSAGWDKGVYKFDVIAFSKSYRANVTSITGEVISNGKVIDRVYQPNWLPGKRVSGIQLKTPNPAKDRVTVYYVENGKTYKYASGINPASGTWPPCQSGVLPYATVDNRTLFLNSNPDIYNK